MAAANILRKPLLKRTGARRIGDLTQRPAITRAYDQNKRGGRSFKVVDLRFVSSAPRFHMHLNVRLTLVCIQARRIVLLPSRQQQEMATCCIGVCSIPGNTLSRFHSDWAFAFSVQSEVPSTTAPRGLSHGEGAPGKRCASRYNPQRLHAWGGRRVRRIRHARYASLLVLCR